MREPLKNDATGAAGRWANQLLKAAADSQQLETVWQHVVTMLRERYAQVEGQLVHGIRGQWQPLTSTPFDLRPLEASLATAADEERIVYESPYAIVPLRIRDLPGLLACFRLHESPPPNSATDGADRLLETLETLQPALIAVVATVWQRQQSTERLRWLEELLRSVDKWNQAKAPDERVYLMERSTVQLLSCQYAFLLMASGSDQRLRFLRRTVADSELARSATPRVWHEEVRRGHVYRSETPHADDLAIAGITLDEGTPRSLMAIPIHGRRHDTVACLMCVNKRAGGFTSQDAEKAIELARHVSTSIHQQPTDIPLGERPPVPTESVTATVRLIGDSESIRDLRHTIQRVSQTELPVLIMGENGTGKEVVSRMIHSGSKRADRPFLAVNCAAISETLLESELFGHEKGSFTDAHRTRAGKFELAHGGTLFLDEIGDMSLTGQVKLLRVLEEKVITRVGGTETIEADVRVLAATNKDLAQLVRDRLFREDLFFRLNVVTLRVPPLRARQRDILLLARHFLEEFSRRVERPIPVLSAEAERRLLQHQWPGNVRELRNLMERIVFLSTEDTVDEQVLAAVLPDSPTQPVGSMELPLSEATRQFQIDYISHHIEAARGNMSEAARRLGLHRSNLYRKLSQLGMAEPQ